MLGCHLILYQKLTSSHFPFSGHRGRRFEDSTIGSESDARMFSDEDDRFVYGSMLVLHDMEGMCFFFQK